MQYNATQSNALLMPLPTAVKCSVAWQDLEDGSRFAVRARDSTTFTVRRFEDRGKRRQMVLRLGLETSPRGRFLFAVFHF